MFLPTTTTTVRPHLSTPGDTNTVFTCENTTMVPAEGTTDANTFQLTVPEEKSFQESFRKRKEEFTSLVSFKQKQQTHDEELMVELQNWIELDTGDLSDTAISVTSSTLTPFYVKCYAFEFKCKPLSGFRCVIRSALPPPHCVIFSLLLQSLVVMLLNVSVKHILCAAAMTFT